MTVMTYSNFRANLRETLDKVNDDMDAVIISSQNGKNTVLISESEYDNMKENLYLLQSNANQERLIESINEISVGKMIERNLIEE